MVRSKSQHGIPVRELFSGFVPMTHRGVFVLLRGYIDESYSDEFFTLSCLKSDIANWRKFESGWKSVLRFINKKLKAQGRQQISRYHAADCSSRKGEFSGWTTEEQIAFTKELLKVFNRTWVDVTAYTIPLKDFADIFPECRNDLIGECYPELLKWLMMEIATKIMDAPSHFKTKPVKITLIHDRCNHDTILLNAFNRVMADPTFGAQHLFSTIAPMSSADCIPLQAADLIAYETFKEAERRSAGRKRRKTLDLLLDMRKSFSGISLGFNRENLQAMRLLYDAARSGKFEGKSDAEVKAIIKGLGI